MAGNELVPGTNSVRREGPSGGVVVEYHVERALLVLQ